jgi:hypothetical protein
MAGNMAGNMRMAGNMEGNMAKWRVKGYLILKIQGI